MIRGGAPTFVIGIGSQRAGSTLLSVALDRATTVFVHPLKELHYFDSIHGVRDFGFLKGRVESLDQLHTAGACGRAGGMNRLLRGRRTSAPVRRTARERRRDAMAARTMTRTVDLIDGCADGGDLAAVPYREFFRPALRRNRVVCEISPEYMLLADSGVRQMREVTGPATRIILQTREQVSRLLSAYVLREIGWGRASSAEDVREEGLWRDLESGSEWWRSQVALSDYAGAGTRFAAHFEHVYVCEMEQLVAGSERELADLADFLPARMDRDAFRAVLARRVNSFGERRFSRTLVKAVDRELSAALGRYATTPASRTPPVKEGGRRRIGEHAA